MRRDSKIGPSHGQRRGSVISEDRRHACNRPTQSERKLIFFLFWILTFLGNVPKKWPKNVSREKIDLQVFPYFLGNQCPMNLLALHILMALKHSQAKTS